MRNLDCATAGRETQNLVRIGPSGPDFLENGEYHNSEKYYPLDFGDQHKKEKHYPLTFQGVSDASGT